MTERLPTAAESTARPRPAASSSLTAVALAAALCGLPASPVVADPIPVTDEAIVSIGGKLYQRHCAECHGADGGGGAVPGVAETVEAPELTGLAARNDGEFPFWELYEQISGTELMPAHASRHMPIWGMELVVDGSEVDAETARGRILALMAYLATLQELDAQQ